MKIIITAIATATILLTSCTNKEKKITTNFETNPLETKNEVTSQESLLAQLDTSLEAPVASVFYVNATSGLSLRSGTNLRSKKILTLPYGAQVKHLSSPAHTTMTVSGITGNMIEVVYQGAVGFVFDGYLTRLAPPQDGESVEGYAKRISTKDHAVQVTKTKNPKGEGYGMTTRIELPTSNWTEAYRITKELFDLPKSLQLDLISKKESEVISNSNKREKTFKDEIAVNRDTASEITSIVYTYQLRDYTRSVTIVKDKNGFIVDEVETSK
ncbi:hypothetical protein [uncultured Dokdonia sp.]|uniref:hypothetical protein n=1 Tax=uncultured Dokdonia sp. TaxID=575653 RepID=UPI0026142A6A|nr:hypothetical protein [uncultured Dokdonia sp.]